MIGTQPLNGQTCDLPYITTGWIPLMQERHAEESGWRGHVQRTETRVTSAYDGLDFGPGLMKDAVMQMRCMTSCASEHRSQRG